MSRFRAAGVHFAICFVVAAVLLALMWFVWYPAPLLEALGGTEIFLMLLAIDVVLGPLLTLIVFKTGKKTLKFDLAVIACVQVAALAYGVYTLLVARPVYLAALGHRFDVVLATDIDEEEIKTANKPNPLFGPVWVGTKAASDPKEKERVMFSGIGGTDYGHFPQHHQPIENMRDEILKEAQPIADLKKFNPGEEAAIDRWLSARGVSDAAVRFQGLKARSKDMAVIVDANTAKVIGIAPFRPWQ